MDVKQTVDIFHHNQTAIIPANSHNPMGARGPVDLPPGGSLPLDLPQGVTGIPEVQHPMELAPGLHPVPAKDGIPYASGSNEKAQEEYADNWQKTDAGSQPVKLWDDGASENGHANPVAARSTGQGQTENHMTPETSPDGK